MSPMTKIDGRILVIEPVVRAATEEHCFNRVDVEVGGFLLGNITDSEVRVLAAQPAETAESGQTQLTFTHEAWDEVLGKLDATFAGMEIVGWYHSHPGFGCFLSEYDIFIQENFFASAGQHALVIDPIAGEDAVFTATSGQAKTIVSGKTDRVALGESLSDLSGNEARATLVEEQIARNSPNPGRRSGATTVRVFGVMILLLLSGGVGWFVGSVQGRDSERSSSNVVIADIQSQLSQTELELFTAQDQLANVPEPVEPPPVVPEIKPTPSETVLTPGSRAKVDVDYQVRSGDSLWLIAQRFLGDGEAYPKLLKWNPKVKETGLVPGNVIVLRVPATIVSSEESP